MESEETELERNRKDLIEKKKKLTKEVRRR